METNSIFSKIYVYKLKTGGDLGRFAQHDAG
jgi:hypothetical protein